MLTYSQAAALFATAKDKTKGKPLGNNTRLIKINNYYSVRLHNTNIVDILPDGSYQLRTGGWRTVTTKIRINEYSPVKVIQKNNIWYIGGKCFQENTVV